MTGCDGRLTLPRRSWRCSKVWVLSPLIAVRVLGWRSQDLLRAAPEMNPNLSIGCVADTVALVHANLTPTHPPHHTHTHGAVGHVSSTQYHLMSALSPLPVARMDIEGWEVAVLTEARSREQLSRFRVIVLEVHNLGRIWNRRRFERMRLLFETVLATHTVVHIHPNNCCGSTERDGLSVPDAMEFSFLRTDRVTDWGQRRDFPHALDRPNMAKLRPKDPDIVLPQEWHAH